MHYIVCEACSVRFNIDAQPMFFSSDIGLDYVYCPTCGEIQYILPEDYED